MDSSRFPFPSLVVEYSTDRTLPSTFRPLALLGDLGLRLGAAAGLDAAGGGAVQVVRGDPALVVGLVGTGGGALAARQRLLFGAGGDAGLLDGAAAAAALGRREQRLDVRLVHEVAGAGEGGREEQVQEDAVVGRG